MSAESDAYVTTRTAFTDPITGATVWLIVPPGGAIFPARGQAKIGVEHPGCHRLADLVPHADAFYCPPCRWNGRVSGAWVADLIDQAHRPADSDGSHDG